MKSFPISEAFLDFCNDAIFFLEVSPPIQKDAPISSKIEQLIENSMVTRCNQSFFTLFKISNKEEIIGKSLHELHQKQFFFANQKTIEAFFKNNHRITDGRIITISSEGKKRYFQAQTMGELENGNLIRIWGRLFEFTEFYFSEVSKKEIESFQDAIINAIPDLKFRVNKKGRFLNFYPSNSDNEKLFVPPEVFLGKTISEVMPKPVATKAIIHLNMAISQQKVTSFEYELSFQDGKKYYEARISPIEAEHALIIIRNMTEARVAQERLREKMVELNQKNEELKKYIESNLQLENFAYIASHDLREPVRTVRSFVQLLSKKILPHQDKDVSVYLDFIKTASDHMNMLIEDLLTYSRINSTAHPVEKIDIQETLEEIIAEFRETILLSKAQINISPMPVIQGFKIKIKQVFQNLISNALKFHKKGEPPQINISYSEQSGHWEFKVVDHGIGIDPVYFDRIFILFQKLNPRNSYQGTGLGLAICKKVIEQHHGRIWVNSTENKGTVFTFTIRKKLKETKEIHPTLTQNN